MIKKHYVLELQIPHKPFSLYQCNDENEKEEPSDECEEIIKKSAFLKHYILEVLKHF